jgi:hypothetical protein
MIFSFSADAKFKLVFKDAFDLGLGILSFYILLQ